MADYLKGASLKGFTDCPIVELGDEPGKLTQIRAVEAISYDGNKITIVIGALTFQIKAEHFYKRSDQGKLEPFQRKELLATLPKRWKNQRGRDKG